MKQKKIRRPVKNGPKPAQEWAKNIAELSRALGIHRSTLHDWRLEKDSPQPTTNGRHHIPTWRTWAEDRSKRPCPSDAKARERLRNTLLHCVRLEYEIAQQKRDYIPTAEVPALLTALIAEAKAIFGQLPDVLAPLVVGASPSEAARIMRAAVDEAFEVIHTGQHSAAPSAPKSDNG